MVKEQGHFVADISPIWFVPRTSARCNKHLVEKFFTARPTYCWLHVVPLCLRYQWLVCLEKRVSVRRTLHRKKFADASLTLRYVVSFHFTQVVCSRRWPLTAPIVVEFNNKTVTTYYLFWVYQSSHHIYLQAHACFQTAACVFIVVALSSLLWITIFPPLSARQIAIFLSSVKVFSVSSNCVFVLSINCS